MFEVFGLTSMAETVYLTILEHPNWDVDDLALHLSIEPAQIREALDDLARSSLVQASSTGSRRAVDPEVGLSMLLAAQQADATRRLAELETGRAACAAFLAERAEAMAGKVRLGLERVEGIDNIRDRLQGLAASAEMEACSFTPGGAQSAASMEASKAADLQAIQRGVRVRTVYLDSIRNDKVTLEYASWLCYIGSEVRLAPTLPIRMLIVDRKVAVVPEDTENTSEAALFISVDSVVTSLMALFNFIWKTSAPLVSRRRRDEELNITQQEAQVLKLLAHGLTDEMIARRLGVSVRTSRRVASDLMVRLEAKSRFQAGAAAMARTWLDEDDVI